MAKGAINVRIEGEYSDRDIKRAIKDLESLKGQSAPAGKAFGGVTTALKGMAIAAAAFVSVSAVKDFMSDAIQQGSALEESLSKVNVVFGESAAEIVDWSKSSSTAFGQSQAQALESVGTFGNLLQAFGSTQAEAQAMSQRMVELAADLASFNNTSVDDALNALRSGLSGETEPLKRFGVALNDARLKTVALEKGLYSGKGTLDVYAKSVAAYELILKDTALAQGDFARTSDGFANQMRIIEASVDNAKAAIGEELVGAISDVIMAFGGVDNAGDAIENFGATIADMVGTLGVMVTDVANVTSALVDFIGTQSDAADSTDDTASSLAKVLVFIPVLGSYLAVWANGAEDARVANEAINDSLRASEDLYAGYAASTDNAAAAQRQATRDTEDAEAALKALKDEVNALKGVLSTNQSVDDFAASLRDLDDTLEGNKRTFKGMSDSALENREVLRTAFSDAAGIVQGFVDEGRISESEFADVFAGTGKKIVDDLVAQGFKKKDIKAFLKAEGLWTSELAAVFSASNNREALTESERLGYDIASGISVGVSNGTPQVKSAVSGTVAAAIEAGKKAGKIQSPSKETRDKIGIPLIDGVIAGMKVKKEDLESTSQSLISDAIDVIEAELQDFDDKIKDALDANNDAKKAIEDWAASTRDTLVSAFDLSAVFEGSYDEQGNFVASKFFGGMDAAIAKFEWYNNVLRKIKESGGSDQLVAFLQSQGVDKGGVWGQSLIDNGLVDYMNQNLTKVTDVADTTAQATVPAFLLAAEENSAALYNQVVKDYGKDGEKRKKLEALMDRLSKALNRTSTITIETVYKSVGLDGKKAAGGPVSANKAYLVGERGPEVLVMGGQSGTIIPNGDLPMASGGVRGGDGASLGGNSYSITVQAGVGDPRAIGQQVVEYIKRFESANGNVFQAA